MKLLCYIGEESWINLQWRKKRFTTYGDPVDIAVDPVEGTRMTAGSGARKRKCHTNPGQGHHGRRHP